MQEFRDKIADAVRDSDEPWYVSFALWAAGIWFAWMAWMVFA